MQVKHRIYRQGQYLLGLDAIRGIASLIVILDHYPYISEMKLNFSVFGLAFQSTQYNSLKDFFETAHQFQALAVQMFYILSGFIFYYIYFTKIQNGNLSLGEYTVHRISRLYPLVWITTLLMVALAFLNGTYIKLNLYNVLTNLFIFRGFGTSGNPSHGGHMQLNFAQWTLGAEMWAYALFFGLCILCKRINKYKLLILSLPVFVGIYVVNLNLKAPDLFNPWMFRVFPGFFMGTLTCAFWQQIKTTKARRAVGILSLILTIFLLSIQLYSGSIKIYGNANQYLLIWSVIGGPAVILSILNIRWLYNLLSTLPFKWLGRISFSIYMWHLPVYSVFSYLYEAGIIQCEPRSKKTMLLVFICVLLVSHASFYFIEGPLQKLIRSKYSAFIHTYIHTS